MKYCLSGRQPNSILKMADEIRVKEEDYRKIMDFIELFPDKTIILELSLKENVDWNLIEMYNQKLNLILCIKDLELLNICLEKKLKYYWYFPITSWSELDALIKFNPTYIYLGSPLVFDLNAVKQKTTIPIRVVVNYCQEAYLPRENGLKDFWIRPEDIGFYEQYISAIDFRTQELTKEKALLKVYQTDKNWPSNLNILLTNLNLDIDNKGIPDDFGQYRANCQQKCMRTGNCHFCDTAITFAKKIKEKALKDKNNKS